MPRATKTRKGGKERLFKPASPSPEQYAPDDGDEAAEKDEDEDQEIDEEEGEE